MKIPCGNCKDRFVTEHYSCHAICEEYKKWNKYHKEELKRIAEKNSIDRNSYSVFEAMEINKKNRR
jgi:hypothetical protein